MLRTATLVDVDFILSLYGDPAFRVSKDIKFYEREELIYFINNPQDNWLFIIEDLGEPIGFLFCKIMTPLWAYLDTLYILPDKRSNAHFRYIIGQLTDYLSWINIKYISTLIKANKLELIDKAKLYMQEQDYYVWFDLLF